MSTGIIEFLTGVAVAVAVIGFASCHGGNNEETGVSAIGAYTPPADWETFTIDDAFTLSVPSTMELRMDSDAYSQFIYANNYNVTDAVFQQKGLHDFDAEALKTYCRIITTHAEIEDPQLHCDEITEITDEDKGCMRMLIDEQLASWNYELLPEYSWIDIDGIKAIDAYYKRTGDNGPVTCHMYFFYNYDEIAQIIISYRDVDANRWKQDLDNVIRTFRWKNAKLAPKAKN